MTKNAAAYSYIRFSTAEQRKGDSLRRQTVAAAVWCKKNNVTLDEGLTFRDLGKSAYLGDHRKNPDRHALAAFLKLVEDGKIPRGSYLIIESLDRLTREHVRAGLMLLLGLIEAGVRIVQLSPSELTYDETSDEMALMLAIVELSRGHRESKRKSDLSGPAWRRKKEGARNGEIVTDRLPAWVTVKDGKLVLIDDNAATVRLIFELAGNGYGTPSIARKLTEEGVKPIGKTGRWVKAYVGNILRDRRALGEYQPRMGKRRVPDGEVVPDYFPRVVTDDEFFAARAGAAERGKLRGRLGSQQINIFAGIIKNARDHDGYYLAMRCEKNGTRRHVLLNSRSQNGAQCFAFQYLPFETAILSKLAEINPREIIGADASNNEVVILSGELATMESRISTLENELLTGDIPSLAKALRTMEESKRVIVSQLAEAKAKAAHPLAESWGETKSLAAALEAAADPDDARLRIRSALRRIVDEIWLLVVPRGCMVRLAAVQIHFRQGGRRDYIIHHRNAKCRYGGLSPAKTTVKSLKDMAGDFDFRKKSDAKQLQSVLETIDIV